MANKPLYLLRFAIDAARLQRLARRHRLPPNDDLGYLLHSGLAALFDQWSPTCFAVSRTEGRVIEVLGYSERPLAELRRWAQAYAEPDAFEICDWESVAEKPMPDSWPSGQELGFRVRVCPTVRLSNRGDHGYREGAEIDAFQAALWRAGEGEQIDRDAVYRDWLAAALERSQGAHLTRAAVDSVRFQSFLRRVQGEERKAAQGLRKPDVTMSGVLSVSDPERFDALLRRGVGRHRAFGFGMVLLRPV